jgi:hypothetical protein
MAFSSTFCSDDRYVVSDVTLQAYGRSVDLMAVFVTIQVFWDMTLFHWVAGYQRTFKT